VNTRTVLWIDELAVGYIDDLPQRLVFIVRDEDGTHLTIWLKSDIFRFEFSSDKPVGSIWDEARRKIARDHPDCGYRDWQKHGNYIVNRTLDYFADSNIPLISLSMPRAIRSPKPSLQSKPAIRITAPSSVFDLSIYFSPARSMIIPDSVAFEGQIGRLLIGLTKRCSEPLAAPRSSFR
jgi:hypothetical protein